MDLPIQPSAAYLLAAPSVPDETREKAVEKAEDGEEISFAAAREIVAEARKKKRPRRQKAVPADKLAGRLVNVLQRYRDRWNLKKLTCRLREFADSLNGRKRGKRMKKEDADHRCECCSRTGTVKGDGGRHRINMACVTQTRVTGHCQHARPCLGGRKLVGLGNVRSL